jgi:hypothetical protein
MISDDRLRLSEDAIRRIVDVLSGEETSLADVARAGGFDPATAFRGLDLKGWPLSGQDVRGFDFSGCDLRKTGVERALRDATTILVGSRLDRSAAKALGLAPATTARRSPRAKPPPGGYDKVRLPTLSDREMLDRDFLIADPTALASVIDDAPPVDEWLTYEGRYEVGADVSCAFSHRHRKGYVFRDEKDRRYLIGHRCGQQHFSLGSWTEFTKGRQGLEDRAFYLRLERDLREAFSVHREWLADLADSAPVRAFDAVRAQIRKRAPGLEEALRRTQDRAGGQLTAPVRERDFQKEERLREAAEEKRIKDGRPAGAAPPIEPQWRMRESVIGVLSGGGMFKFDRSVGDRLRDIAAFAAMFVASDNEHGRRLDLARTTKRAREQVLGLVEAQEQIEASLAFFGQVNLDLVARWATAREIDRATYESAPSALIVRRRGRDRPSTIRMPADLTLLDAMRISALTADVLGVAGRLSGSRQRS